MIVHLNGQLLPRDQARISPFDRGFIFGDGLYEGLRASAFGPEQCARVVAPHLHTARLAAGLRLTGIDFDAASLEPLTTELLAANNLTEAFVYWQITRGTPTGDEPVRSRVPGGGRSAPRAASLRAGPTVFGYCVPQPPFDDFARLGPTVKSAVTLDDPRWSLGHIKSISLMGNIMASLRAMQASADDAILCRNGLVAEGLATNVILRTPDNRLVTPNLESAPMLAGVTRAVLLDALPNRIDVRPVRVEELATAREIILVGSMTMVASVTRLNEQPVGEAPPTPGPAARELLTALIESFRSGRDREVGTDHMHPRTPPHPPR
ncbi:MAG: aminotransferase class IV [Phycisphaeraceae bacterium]|nr:aminotransferase class IV [Phycisphaeraceae bacterium]